MNTKLLSNIIAVSALMCGTANLWATPDRAVNQNNSCSVCHGASQPSYMQVVGEAKLLDIGTQLDGKIRGAVKTFTAVPGGTVRLSMEVLNGANPYALQVKRLEKPGQQNSVTNFLVWAESNDVANVWTMWQSNNVPYNPYFTKGIFSGGETGTNYFDLYLDASTPPDVYDLEFSLAGRDFDILFYGDEHFYIQVLTPVPPTPLITSPTRSATQFSVQVATSSGFTYYLEYKTSLTNPSWNVAVSVPGNGAVQTLTDTTATDPQRFYHVRVQ